VYHFSVYQGVGKAEHVTANVCQHHRGKPAEEKPLRKKRTAESTYDRSRSAHRQIVEHWIVAYPDGYLCL
jgi:hypothetical protein